MIHRLAPLSYFIVYLVVVLAEQRSSGSHDGSSSSSDNDLNSSASSKPTLYPVILCLSCAFFWLVFITGLFFEKSQHVQFAERGVPVEGRIINARGNGDDRQIVVAYTPLNSENKTITKKFDCGHLLRKGLLEKGNVIEVLLIPGQPHSAILKDQLRYEISLDMDNRIPEICNQISFGVGLTLVFGCLAAAVWKLIQLHSSHLAMLGWIYFVLTCIFMWPAAMLVHWLRFFLNSLIADVFLDARFQDQYAKESSAMSYTPMEEKRRGNIQNSVNTSSNIL
mmetsp:Transcript_11344/g.17214  ORF Transcript_11344/g.17214 Transcript_11344/m.17214 type:complete len:280 (-) Transcript_11344:107-946(-)